MIARRPCLVLIAYTVTVIVGVTALVATDGPREHDGEMPARSPGCMRPGLDLRAPDDAASARAAAKRAMSYASTIGRDPAAVSDAVQCFWSLNTLADWHEGHFNWREGGAICFWIALLLVPAWVFCARRRAASSLTLTVEQVQALAKRLPR